MNIKMKSTIVNEATDGDIEDILVLTHTAIFNATYDITIGAVLPATRVAVATTEVIS